MISFLNLKFDTLRTYGSAINRSVSFIILFGSGAAAMSIRSELGFLVHDEVPPGFLDITTTSRAKACRMFDVAISS